MLYFFNLILKSLLFFSFLGGFFVRASKSEHPLVVVVPSYNNAQWYQKNLDSIFMQQYEHYRVIYIDDCSPDGTYELVKRYVSECQYKDRITLLKNKERRGALANHFKAVHMCENHEIIVTLDGDDWFAHERVLDRVNEAYNDSDVWLTYGQHEIYPTNERGKCRKMRKAVITHNAYREYEWITSALRTFYAGLFKRIKLQDLLYEGDFFAVSGDLAFMYPMLEMAAGRISFIDEILYIYNCETPDNDFKERLIMQLHAEHVIRGMPKYEPIKSFACPNKAKTCSAEVIIFSSDNPVQLCLFIQSISSNLAGVGNITVLYQSHPTSLKLRRTGGQKYDTGYHYCSEQFPQINFIACVDSNLKKNVIDILKTTSSQYVMFARDDMVVKDIITIDRCIRYMEQTQAYGFYLALGKNIVWSDTFIRPQEQPYLVELEDNVFAWQVKDGEGDWCNYNNLFCTIYRKSAVYQQLQSLNITSFAQLERQWEKVPIDGNSVCLCFENSKVVGINLCRDSIQSRELDILKRVGLSKQFDNVHRGITNNESIYIEPTRAFIYSLFFPVRV